MHRIILSAAIVLACVAVSAARATTVVVIEFPDVATIQALGAGAAQFPQVHVPVYAAARDSGGGYFSYEATCSQSVDGGVYISVTGVPGACWRRQLNGIPLNVDFWGTGNADDSAAFAHAFAYCAKYTTHLSLGARSYQFQSNPTYPSGSAGVCNFDGQGPTSTYLDFTNYTGGGTGLSMVGGSNGNLLPGPIFGGFTIIGNRNGDPSALHTITTGLYISGYVRMSSHDVNVEYVKGPCWIVGQTVASSIYNPFAYGCGSAGRAMFEIFGEADSSGNELVGTTLSIYDAKVETDAGFGASYGMTVDRYETVHLTGGTIESTAINLGVGTRSSSSFGVSNLIMTGMDLEGAQSSAQAILIGSGWGGAAGQAVTEMSMVGDTIYSYVPSVTQIISLSNTTGFQTQALDFGATNSGAIVYNFAGTGNSQAVLGQSLGTHLASPVYVKVNGTAIAGANNAGIWSMAEDTPIHAAQLTGANACSAALQGHRRLITDLAAVPTFGAVITTSSGGASAVWSVTCHGASWIAGG